VDNDRPPLTAGDLGERALIERIAPRFGPPAAGEVWSGDDTATIRAPGTELLFTTDLMVEDVDFKLSYSSGFDVGWKLIAANASDIAAMGGRPWRAVASIALRPETEVAFVDAFADGMAALSKELGLGLVGGDFSSGREISASVAMLGIAPDGGPVLRSGARAGDVLCVTGALGGAAGGLLVLEEGIDGPGSGERDALAAASQRPRPRVNEGRVLADHAHAMIDLSDGLAVDLGHMTQASGIGCEVDLDAVPLHEALGWLQDRRPQTDPLGLALTGGEDFELLLSLDDSELSEARARLGEQGTSLTRIGVVTEGPARIGNSDLDDWRAQGWEHLHNP
jgi:thiamine-monophosphate kinase